MQWNKPVGRGPPRDRPGKLGREADPPAQGEKATPPVTEREARRNRSPPPKGLGPEADGPGRPNKSTTKGAAYVMMALRGTSNA